MIEELKDEELIKKVGGRFKLSALIQKRLVVLNKGARSPIDYSRTSSSTRDKLNTVIQEILHEKIYLDTDNQVVVQRSNGVDMTLDAEFTEGY